MIIRILLLLILNLQIAYADELKVINVEDFYNQKPSHERKAILDFIVNQFDGKKVSQADLGKLWDNKEIREGQKLIRFQIVNQKLYADSFDIGHLYFVVLFDYFQNFIKQYQVPDVDFIVHASDEISPKALYHETIDIPSFMMSKNLDSAYERNKLLMPDAHMVKPKWSELVDKLNKTNDKILWNDKVERIFWRGNASGGIIYPYQVENFDKLPRLNLVVTSKLYPDFIDARFTMPIDTSLGKGSKDLAQILKILFGDKYQHISEEEHLKYKYLISIDGNTCAWMRVPWIMFSNSVLVKQQTNKVEWFYSALKPYVNYVPVNTRLTDLFQIIEWMKSHDREVQKISENAHDLIANNLMPEHIDSHMAIILNKYHNIQIDKKINPTLTPAEDVISISVVIKLLLKRAKNYFVELF